MKTERWRRTEKDWRKTQTEKKKNEKSKLKHIKWKNTLNTQKTPSSTTATSSTTKTEGKNAIENEKKCFFFSSRFCFLFFVSLEMHCRCRLAGTHNFSFQPHDWVYMIFLHTDFGVVVSVYTLYRPYMIVVYNFKKKKVILVPKKTLTHSNVDRETKYDHWNEENTTTCALYLIQYSRIYTVQYTPIPLGWFESHSICWNKVKKNVFTQFL